MKSLEEIRKGLEKHMNSALPCKGNCPYYQPDGYDPKKGSCAEQLYDDVYEFVFHTEKYYPPKDENCVQLEKHMPRWKAACNPPEKSGTYLVMEEMDGKITYSWDIFNAEIGWCGNEFEKRKLLYWMYFEELEHLQKEENE